MPKTLLILKSLMRGVRTTAELIRDVVPNPSRPYKFIIKRGSNIPKSDYEQWKMGERRKLYTLVSHLKKDGLVIKKVSNGKSVWQITKEGLGKLNILNNKKVLPKIKYEVALNDYWSIVIFDVPEKHKFKRVWIRGQLKSLGFELLQKSVWIGKSKIPKSFIDDLERIKLIPHVHIFAISKRGSLTDRLIINQ